MIQKWIISIFLLLLLVSPVMATFTTSEANSVNSYSVVAEPGNVIYEILIDPVPMGTNQTHTLNYDGSNFLLSVGSAQSWGIYHDFTISLTMPNGTVSTHSARYVGLSGGSYKLDIQPVFYHIQSLNPTFAVYVNVGLSPLMTEFNTMSSDFDPLSSNYAASTGAIPFSSASGELGYTTNVFVYQTSKQEFVDSITNYDPYTGIQNFGNDLFQWTWSQILGFVYMIPVIGPIFVSFLTLAGTVLSELFFWVEWIVRNFPAILLSIETLIMMMAVINTPKGKKSLSRLLSNIYQYNMAVARGFMTLFNYTLVWLTSIVQTIASIVQSLKPL